MKDPFTAFQKRHSRSGLFLSAALQNGLQLGRRRLLDAVGDRPAAPAFIIRGLEGARSPLERGQKRVASRGRRHQKALPTSVPTKGHMEGW